MKALLLSLCAAAGLALTANPAKADDGWRRGYSGYYRYPNSWSYRPYYEQRFYTQPYYGYYGRPYRPSYYSTPYYYGPRYGYGSGYGYSGPGVSFWIGR